MERGGPPPGLHETLALLTSQLRPDVQQKEDLAFLQEVLSERSLGFLVKIHEKLERYEKQNPTPELHGASRLLEDLREELQDGPLEEDERELLLLLSTPHLKAVLSAHDTVAQKNFDPVLPPLPDDLEDELEEESVKIVRLVKNKEPLGATIRRDESTGAVIVARIMRGGAADRSGLVHVGDELREVNGNPVGGRRPEEISQILSQSQGSITLKIIPAPVDEDKLKESRVYLRALFDYEPSEDKAAPCQEAGLAFRRRDILQVVSQEDATWWQAKRLGDCNLRAALIPSTHFQERRLKYRLKMGSFPSSLFPRTPTSAEDRNDREDSDSEEKDGVSPKTKAAPAFCGRAFSWDLYSAGRRRSLRLKKEGQSSPDAPAPDAGRNDFLIYEEVTRYSPQHGARPRLVVLLGSLGSRVAELKQKVIAENPRRYGLAVPHTTRLRRLQERDGLQYHFTSRAAFEADIHLGRFIEYGEYKENLYGTSLESIRRILDQNKVCIVDVQPEALLTLRTAEFKPYVILVRPSLPDGPVKALSVGMPGDEPQDVRLSAERMDECYGHWADYVLVKGDPVSAQAELQEVLERLQTEPQWVPVSWAQP